MRIDIKISSGELPVSRPWTVRNQLRRMQDTGIPDPMIDLATITVDADQMLADLKALGVGQTLNIRSPKNALTNTVTFLFNACDRG